MGTKVYVWRVEVDKWPTDDGLPWLPAYGWVTRFADVSTTSLFDSGHEIPEWLLDRMMSALKSELPSQHAMRERMFRGQNATGVELLGVVMPSLQRKNWLSPVAAYACAHLYREFGADVRVLRSQQIEWVESREVQ